MILRSIVLLGSIASFSTLFAQSGLYCVGSAVPPIVHAEGISEKMGDIVLTCTGGEPDAAVTGNLTAYLDVSVTNRLAADGTLNVFLSSGTNGSTNVPSNVPARLFTSNSVMWNGVTFQLSDTGAVGIRISNLRGNASEKGLGTGLGQSGLITAFLGFNGSIGFNTNTVTVARPEPGLLFTQQSRIVCGPSGSPLPSEISVSNLLTAGSTYSSMRVTEGFASSFEPLSSPLEADTGTRIIIRYSNFTAGSQLFVPDAIAGVDADAPTSAGDMGFPASGGQYTAGKNQLLLIRVAGADPNGAGGSLVMPPPTGSVTFNSASEVSLSGGAGYAVYEVVDANPSLRESAQIPTFLGLAPSRGGTTVMTEQTVNLAPISTIVTASTTAPIPRFTLSTPESDCSALNDCAAGYFPRMKVSAPQKVQLTAVAGSPAATKYIQVNNAGSGVLRWNATVSSGASWLKLSPASGVNGGTIRIDASTTGLAAGAYDAIITINGGPLAGAQTVPVTLQVSAAEPAPIVPVIDGIGNAADASVSTVVPGSIASIFGSNLNGQAVTVTFDGVPATILYSDAKQVNLVAPAGLAGKSSAQVIVSADGNASAPTMAKLGNAAPAIFPGAVLNQDYSVNSESNPAHAGSVVQVFATGLPSNGVITAKIHDQVVTAPYYGGPAPGLPGVQQVNIIVPALPTTQTSVYVCGGTSTDDQVCSPAAKIWIAQ